MKFFSHFFRTPSYLHVPAFGLDISDNSLKYARLAPRGDGFVLGEYGQAEIPAGIIASGVILKEAALTEILSRAFALKRNLHYVSLSLPEEKGFVRVVRLPLMSPEELQEAVPLQLEEQVPLSAAEASMSYQVLPPDQPGAEYQDIVLVAFPRGLVDSYITTARAAGLIPIALELEAQATSRSVIPASERSKTILIADIGLTRTGFMIVENGVVEFTSTMPIGGKHINQAIQDTLRVSAAETEKVKIRYGLSPSPEGTQITLALAPILAAIREEAARRIEFWHAHAVDLGKKTTREVEKMFLCGGDANLIGFTGYLSAELNIPVSLANVWVNTSRNHSYVPEIEFNASLGYATAVGLALGVAGKDFAL